MSELSRTAYRPSYVPAFLMGCNSVDHEALKGRDFARAQSLRLAVNSIPVGTIRTGRFVIARYEAVEGWMLCYGDGR